MGQAALSLASKNYGSWSLRGWLLCKLAGLDFGESTVSSDDPSTRAELLLLSPSFLVPCLTHDGVKVWATLAIVLPRIVTVLFGTIRPSTTSMTFTRVIARARVWGSTETVVMNVAASESKQIVALRSTMKLLNWNDTESAQRRGDGITNEETAQRSMVARGTVAEMSEWFGK